MSHYSGALLTVQAIREQSGLVMETANAKAAAEILAAKKRSEELEVSGPFVASGRSTSTLGVYLKYKRELVNHEGEQAIGGHR